MVLSRLPEGEEVILYKVYNEKREQVGWCVPAPDFNPDFVHNVIEEYCKLVLKPKPKWLPQFFYNWLISKFVVTQYFK